MNGSSRLRVGSARDLGPQFRDNPVRMIGQDGAYSIPLNGEVLWFFGDTYVGPPEAAGPRHLDRIQRAERVITNTGLLTSQRDASRGITEFRYITDAQGELRPLIPPLPWETPDTFRTWCQHGCCLGGRLYLYFIQVRMLDYGPWLVNFEVTGAGLAVGSRRDFTSQRVEREGSCLLWGPKEPHLGGAVLRRAGDPKVYLYGSLRGEDEVQRCYVARGDESDLTAVERYQYWTGEEGGWGSRPEAAAPLFDGMPNELSVSFNEYLGCFLAVHSVGLEGEIVGRTAPEPWGPWSEPVLLWRATLPEYDPPPPAGAQIYAGKEHPELAREGGRILYVTYIEFEEYFPRLVEVTLE